MAETKSARSCGSLGLVSVRIKSEMVGAVQDGPSVADLSAALMPLIMASSLQK
jgi:hypothetical protein